MLCRQTCSFYSIFKAVLKEEIDFWCRNVEAHLSRFVTKIGMEQIRTNLKSPILKVYLLLQNSFKNKVKTTGLSA